MPLGGLPNLLDVIDSGNPVHVYATEGDSDAEALRQRGLIAVTAGGTNDWKPEHIDQLDGIDRVTFTSDADEPGRGLAGRMRGWLTERNITHRVVEPIDGCKDIREHLENGHPLDGLVNGLLQWPEQDDDQPDGPAADEPEPSSWQPVDLTPVLAGDWQLPIPTVGLRSDGKHLFYLTKTHTMIGATEVGKDWAALCASADEMNAGNHVVYIDFEDDQGTVVNRLLTLGVSRDLIRTHFHYIRPEHPLIGRHLDILIEVLQDYQPTLVILVGITEAMNLHGLDPLSNTDISSFDRTVVRQLTRSGAAEVSLDHVIKDANNRGKYALAASTS
jgi:hypothetical protein